MSSSRASSSVGSVVEQQYKVVKKIGQGTYGMVYMAKEVATGKIVALKVIRVTNKQEGIPSTAMREVSILKYLRHPNIVHLQNVFLSSSSLTLVFEFLDQDLKHFIDLCGKRGIDAHSVASIAFQMLQGLAYCHAHKFMHRDLKPQNLLVSIDGELKIADFGLARGFGVPVKQYANVVVTLWYRPPDVLLGRDDYGTEIDMWGVGCIIAEMFNGKALFPGHSVQSQLEVICSKLGTPTLAQWPGVRSLAHFRTHFWQLSQYPAQKWEVLVPRAPPAAIDLLSKLLVIDPAKRLSAKDALRHPFFADLRRQTEEQGGKTPGGGVAGAGDMSDDDAPVQ